MNIKFNFLSLFKSSLRKIYRIIQGSLKNANFVICKIYICKVCFDYLYIYNQILVFKRGIGVSGCLEVRVEVLGLFEEFC